jgi:Uma2 family endonuclease
MQTVRRTEYTLAEYLSLEAMSNTRHEYLDGQIYAMSGGTPEHSALIAAAIHVLFRQLLGGRCRPLDSNARIRVPATGLDTYPDISVVCGPRLVDIEDPLAIVNPTVLVEVLSPSTQKYDRGEKFEHYKRLPTLMHYVLVSQEERRVEVWSRGEVDDVWHQAVAHDGETAPLPAVQVTLDVRELYTLAADPVA